MAIHSEVIKAIQRHLIALRIVKSEGKYSNGKYITSGVYWSNHSNCSVCGCEIKADVGDKLCAQCWAAK